jgi:tetratricopeptide (TPR) repeat protein
LAAAAAPAAAQPRVTFTRDVAPIIFEHCSRCHRPGEIAPFSLLTFQDVRPRAAAIARVTETRQMPPWKPEPGYGEFVGARRLTNRQLDTIRQWVRDGAPEGDPANLPSPPPFNDGWQLGEPDLIVTMTEPFTVPASGSDLLRNFVIPIPLASVRYVRGIEFRPGNHRVVHHANMRIDRTGAARRADAADRNLGFDGFISAGNFPDGHFLGWTPGQLPPLADGDLTWPLDPGSDLVVQLHMRPVGTASPVQVSVGFFFSNSAPRRTPMMLRLGRQNIDIAAGQRDYVSEDRYVLPVDVDAIGVQPHAHYRAKQIEGRAILPDGTEQWLIHIKDWDFNWQDAYRFAKPIRLPRGTVLTTRFTYDNSPANRRNPDRPPRRVRWGQNSSDEMGDLWIQVLPRSDEEREALRADFAPKVMAEDAVGYEKLLEVDPANPRVHEAVAAIDLALGKIDVAVGHLEASLRVDPQSVEAHYNLATALVRSNRPVEAIEHFRRALQIQPDHVAAHVNLGVALRAERRFAEAADSLRQALALDPRNAAAHTNLAGVLAAQNNRRDAIGHYRQALELRPDLLEALADLAWILATAPDVEIQAPADAVHLAERAANITKMGDVRALDTLAAAYAAAGRFDRAIATVERALELAKRSNSDETVPQLNMRIAVYRAGRAWREP